MLFVRWNGAYKAECPKALADKGKGPRNGCWVCGGSHYALNCLRPKGGVKGYGKAEHMEYRPSWKGGKGKGFGKGYSGKGYMNSLTADEFE